ncbi:MAG TPA: amidase family protein [Gemmatimonadaceae bacterium]|nr:amidase family protein [Gemmatimonadaceae bacterium]
MAGIVRKSLDSFKAHGAEVVDITVPGLDDLLRDSSVIGDEFKFDLAAYLAKQANAPVKSLGEILERGLHHAALDATFRLRNATEKRETEHYRQAMIKRRALRAAVLATLDEQRIDALAYPTLRRKPALIGEAQGGTNCQLSATTGLPAIAMPAGFTADGLPIAVELLGGAWEEAKLLKYAFAWEQAAKLRRPPFSTPPLVKGVAPAPTAATIAIGPAVVKFNYDSTTAALKFDATAEMSPTDRVLGLAIHRTESDKPGPVIAQLLAPNQLSGSGTLVMRGRNREDLVAGKLFLQFYTKQSPLGVDRQPITLR